MKKYIIALIVLLLAVAAYLKFWRKPPPDQNGAQDGESGQTGGTGSASSDTSSNATNTNAGGSVVADTKNQLTKAQVLEIQKRTNERIKMAKAYTANHKAYAGVMQFLPDRVKNDLYVMAAAASKLDLLREDGVFGEKTAKAFQIVFNSVITKNSDFNQVKMVWTTPTQKEFDKISTQIFYGSRGKI